jgi:serine/threonine protein phosphatase 1
MTFFSRFIRGSRRRARIADGQRIYAIGDVHGEARLLTHLLHKIEEDQIDRVPKSITLIFLGDVIDRGPGSDLIVQSLMQAECPGLILLKGNHEQILVDAYRGDDDALSGWLRFGGSATLESFGIDVPVQDRMDFADLRDRMHERIGDTVVDWLDQRPVWHGAGDYFFVHAGIRPGVPLDRQSEDDMMWIRQAFTDSRRDHGKVIVHGHTVQPGPVKLGGNRINVDTGAHHFGHLTALGLDGDEQWVIEVTESEVGLEKDSLDEAA